MKFLEHLEPSGWLGKTVNEIASECGINLDFAEKILYKLQTCEPAGLFARDLKECLLIQAKATEKLFYSIGETAKMFDVNVSLIRFWEKKFDILKPKKNKKGNRLFTKKDIDNLQIIYHLVKERGFTLEGAKRKLKENKNDTIENIEIVNRLKEIKAFLIKLKEEL